MKKYTNDLKKVYRAIKNLLKENTMNAKGYVPVASTKEEKELIDAADANDTEKVKELVEFIEEVNICDKNGFTPLHYAVHNRNIQLCIFLIKNGAEVDVKEKDNHATPLHIAVGVEDGQMVKMLVRNGADLNVLTDEGYSPLGLAIFRSNEEIASLLIDEGADVNINGNDYKMSMAEYAQCYGLNKLAAKIKAKARR